MRKLIFQEYVSLDGYAAGPGDELSFFETVTDQDPRDNLGPLESVDTMVLGATTYRLFVDYWPTATDEVIAPQLNRLRKVVMARGRGPAAGLPGVAGCGQGSVPCRTRPARFGADPGRSMGDQRRTAQVRT
jgi:hypothetical protein